MFAPPAQPTVGVRYSTLDSDVLSSQDNVLWLAYLLLTLRDMQRLFEHLPLLNTNTSSNTGIIIMPP